MAIPKRRANMPNLLIATLLLCLTTTTLSLSIDLPDPIPPPRVLLIGDPSLKETHKEIMTAIEETSGKVTHTTPEAPSIPLFHEGEYLYDAVLILAPTASLSAKLPLSSIKSFLAAGNTLFLAASTSPSAYTTSLAAAIGLDLSKKPLLDHVNVFSELDDGSRTYVRAGGNVLSKRLFGSAATSSGDIVFNGPGATLLKDNELVRPVIWGSPSCFSRDGHATGVPRVAGSSAVLAAAISSRTGGRASYFGSLPAMSDSAMSVAGERHRVAVKSFVMWTLGAHGMLHVGQIKHWSFGHDKTIDPAYRVGDPIGVSLEVMEWKMAEQRWVPFAADDMQVELTMLNPYVRARLRDIGNGTFTTTVTAPNQIGIYKFVVEYNRPGVSQISELEVVPIRPLLHNEYERFISMAAPYYFASFTMLITVFLLGIVLMFGTETSSSPHEKEA